MTDELILDPSTNGVTKTGVAVREAMLMREVVAIATSRERSIPAVYDNARTAFSKLRLAERAFYRFPRGGEDIIGPSVVMARELARMWGAIRYGMRVLERTDDEVHVQGWAVDLQNLVMTEHDMRFQLRVPRKVLDQATGSKVTRYVRPNPREELELVNAQGARAVRSALLQILPRDLVDDTLEQVLKVSADAADPARVGAMVKAFEDLGVTAEALEAAIGNPLDRVTGQQITRLRADYNAIRDGEASAADLFPDPTRKKAPSEIKASAESTSGVASPEEIASQLQRAVNAAKEFEAGAKAEPAPKEEPKPKTRRKKSKKDAPTEPAPAAPDDDDEDPFEELREEIAEAATLTWEELFTRAKDACDSHLVAPATVRRACIKFGISSLMNATEAQLAEVAVLAENDLLAQAFPEKAGA